MLVKTVFLKIALFSVFKKMMIVYFYLKYEKDYEDFCNGNKGGPSGDGSLCLDILKLASFILGSSLEQCPYAWKWSFLSRASVQPE